MNVKVWKGKWVHGDVPGYRRLQVSEYGQSALLC
jgi:hypothetical protein